MSGRSSQGPRGQRRGGRRDGRRGRELRRWDGVRLVERGRGIRARFGLSARGLVLRALTCGPGEALGRDEMAARVRETTRRSEGASCCCVEFGLGAPRFGTFGEVAVKAENVVHGLTAFRVASDVLRPVVAMSDDMTVKAAPSTGRAFTDFCDRVNRAAKATSDGSQKGAHGVVIEPGRVVVEVRVEVFRGEGEVVRRRAERIHEAMTGRVVFTKGAAGASGLLSRRAAEAVKALCERGLETSADPLVGRTGARHGLSRRRAAVHWRIGSSSILRLARVGERGFFHGGPDIPPSVNECRASRILYTFS